MTVYQFLSYGAENAKTSGTLCAMMNITRRELTKAIEKERRAGQPICSTCNGHRPGYYLASNRNEMQAYCNSLRHRAGEIFKTRRACLAAMEQLPVADPEGEAEI